MFGNKFGRWGGFRIARWSFEHNGFIWACLKGYFEIVKFLFENNCGINQINNFEHLLCVQKISAIYEVS